MLKLAQGNGGSRSAWKHTKRARPPSSSSSKLNSAHITKLHSYTPAVPHAGAKRGERLLLPCLQNLQTSYNLIQLSFRNHVILKEAAGLWRCRISPLFLPWLAALQLDQRWPDRCFLWTHLNPTYLVWLDSSSTLANLKSSTKICSVPGKVTRSEQSWCRKGPITEIYNSLIFLLSSQATPTFYMIFS